jgi:FixJ family two-component response regulator
LPIGIDARSVMRHRTNLMVKLEVRAVAEHAQLASKAAMSKF